MRLGIWAISIALVATAAPAQDAVTAQGQQEVVVTGARMTDYDPQYIPHVSLIRRADNLITKVRVVCDTRDLTQRKNELKATLREMIRTAAATPSISLGLGDEIVGDFNESMFDEVIVPDSKEDTSVAYVVIKTAISKTDTYDAATARIKAFIDKTPKSGRTEILRENKWNLTLIGPERNRDELIKMIVADARRTADLFGPGFGVSVDGLQHPIAWYQAGPLDLALYITYSVKMEPGRAP